MILVHSVWRLSCCKRSAIWQPDEQTYMYNRKQCMSHAPLKLCSQKFQHASQFSLVLLLCLLYIARFIHIESAINVLTPINNQMKLRLHAGELQNRSGPLTDNGQGLDNNCWKEIV